MEWLDAVWQNTNNNCPEYIKNVFKDEKITSLLTFRTLAETEITELCSRIKLGHRVQLREAYKREQGNSQQKVGTYSSSKAYSSLIRKYVGDFGWSVKEARHIIGTTHGMWRSLRTANWHAHRLGLGRVKKDGVHIDQVIHAVQAELDGSCRNMGANVIWNNLKRKHNLRVKRQLVRDVLEAADPGRGERLKKQRLRRRIYCVKGPNHIWHIDGNDKLKPYGLCISACMDGFSRRLIWLKVARTNKNPSVICAYFLEAVNDLSLLPRVVRLDRGTENVHVASSQTALRSHHMDSLAPVAVMYGASTHNQRIERFWSYLRQVILQEYMTLLRGYLDSGVVDSSNPLHMECMAFCFLPVIRGEMQTIFTTWNNHRVRKMAHSGCPSGIPNILFEHCDIHGVENQAQEVDREILIRCEQEYANHQVVDFDSQFEEWAGEYMFANDISLPKNIDEACTLFSQLMLEIAKE